MYFLNSYWIFLNILLIVFVFVELNKGLIRTDIDEPMISLVLKNVKSLKDYLYGTKIDDKSKEQLNSAKLKSEYESLLKKIDQVKTMLEGYIEIKTTINNYLKTQEETYAKIREIKENIKNI
jgi:hypothetical protein